MDDLTGALDCCSYRRMSSVMITTQYRVEVKGVSCFI